MKRFKTEPVPYPISERIRIWIDRVWAAITEPIPVQRHIFVEVTEDDPDYDNAPYVQQSFFGIHSDETEVTIDEP